MVKASFFQCLITASLKNTSTIISCHLTAMKVVDYSLAGWSHSLVVLHKQTTLAFANFSEESRVTFIQFFSLIHDNVIIKILAFCSQLPNIHAYVCGFDCILLLLFWQAFVFHHQKFPLILPPIFFLRTKTNLHICG